MTIQEIRSGMDSKVVLSIDIMGASKKISEVRIKQTRDDFVK